MARKHKANKLRQTPKAVLKLPDLDQAKSAVLNTLSSADAQRGYRRAMDEFIEWYRPEPRLSFNSAVVLRYRMQLNQGTSRRERSTSVLVWCDAWRPRLIAVLSVRTSPGSEYPFIQGPRRHFGFGHQVRIPSVAAGPTTTAIDRKSMITGRLRSRSIPSQT